MKNNNQILKKLQNNFIDLNNDKYFYLVLWMLFSFLVITATITLVYIFTDDDFVFENKVENNDGINVFKTQNLSIYFAKNTEVLI